MESRLDIAAKIAEELEIKKWQVEAVIKLIDEGNTIPFTIRKRFSAQKYVLRTFEFVIVLRCSTY